MAKKRGLGWHTVSLDTLRGLGTLLAVLLLVGGGFFGYRHWEGWALERQASGLVEEARDLTARIHARGELRTFEEEFASGRQILAEAEESYRAGQLREAAEKARRSRDVLAAILSMLERKGEGGDAQFLSVHGGVEFRRGDSDEWEDARNLLVLGSGDRVRTGSNGSAEIMFADGTLYTVSPNSSIVVTRRRSAGGEQQAVRMEHGNLGLMTRESPTRVETPAAEAEVSSDSEALITYEQESRSGRIAAVRGRVRVSNESGQERTLEDLQQVVQQGSLLSEPEPLPSPPQLMAPADMREIDAREGEVSLTWLPVEGARGYTLQVSRNRLFVDNVIEDGGRRKTSARLGIRGEGSFQWRVAAEGRQGERGPWSAPRTFRVAAGATPESGEDKEPPKLVIEDAVGYGSIFIVEGQTEPGATVTVNGESVQVDGEGNFTKTTQLTGEGLGFIEVKATDAWGNTAEERRRVYVEGS